MEPYKIFDFPDEAAWLKGRMNGIGGSDASAVVGMNPYKSNIDLFEEKIGRRIPEDISDKPCVVYGKLAEAPIREPGLSGRASRVQDPAKHPVSFHAGIPGRGADGSRGSERDSGDQNYKYPAVDAAGKVE